MITETDEQPVKGGRHGEMFLLPVVKLMDIKENRPGVYALIQEETEWMIAYARKTDYIR